MRIPDPKKVFGQGCVIDWDNNIVHGADGVTYYDVEISQQDLKRLLLNELEKKPPKCPR